MDIWKKKLHQQYPTYYNDPNRKPNPSAEQRAQNGRAPNARQVHLPPGGATNKHLIIWEKKS